MLLTRPPWLRTGAPGGPGRVVVAAWLLLVGAGVAVLLAERAGWVPAAAAPPAAGAVTTMYAGALASRIGARTVLTAVTALLLAGVVVTVDQPVLRGGAAVLTMTVAAALSVLATRPAQGVLPVVREVGVALLLGLGGAVAAIGYGPSVHLLRFEYGTLVLGLLVTVLLAHRVGAIVHEVEPRVLALALAGIVALLAVLVYAELLRRYGPGLAPGGDLLARLRATGVPWPEPVQVLVGVPALAWGVHRRARRRQGWWVAAFGVTASTPLAARVVENGSGMADLLVATGIAAVAGLLLAGLVIRVDVWWSEGSGGARARRVAPAAREEPPRSAPLI